MTVLQLKEILSAELLCGGAGEHGVQNIHAPAAAT